MSGRFYRFGYCKPCYKIMHTEKLLIDNARINGVRQDIDFSCAPILAWVNEHAMWSRRSGIRPKVGKMGHYKHGTMNLVHGARSM